jgi:exopolysaccharide biosynthesis polyprenyl glycosylphosphotransferase
MNSTEQNQRAWLQHLPRLSLPVSERRVLLVVVDALIVNGAILAALAMWCALNAQPMDAAFVAARWRWFPSLTLTWWLLGWSMDLYDLNVSARRLVVLRQVATAMLVLVAGYLVVYFVMPPSIMPRLFLGFFAVTAAVGLGAWRTGYEALLTAPPLQRRSLIVGAGWAGRTCADLLQGKGRALYRVVGFVDDDPEKWGMTIADLPVLGGSADLLDLADEYEVDKLVLAITGRLQGALFRALVQCRAHGLTVVRLPKLYAVLTKQVPVDHIDMGWALDALDDFDTSDRLQAFARRALDLACAAVGLVALGLVTPLVGLATWLEDRGPIFYKQVRAGRAGKPFEVWKFRSMREDAEADGKARWATEHDDRITRVGRVLRKTRLDELPQVLNVLRGDMHVVGPRPERPAFIADLEANIPFYRTRLTVKPGLTGWAQIHYEYGNSIEDAKIKLQYDLYYIRHRTLWMDLYVIIQTVGVVLRMGGM